MKEDVLLVKDVVENILKTDHRARNDDKWLNYCVQRRFVHIYIPFEEFSNMPSFESISRCRRKIQAEGLYLADKEVKVGRAEEEKEMTGINKWL